MDNVKECFQREGKQEQEDIEMVEARSEHHFA